MALSYSKALRNYILSGGSMKEALNGGVINVYSGAAPANADAAVTGSLLYTFTDYAGARGGETLATGTANYTGGMGGSIATLTVNGVSVISGPVDNPGASLASLMVALAANINSFASSPDYTAVSSPTSITLSALSGTGAGPNGFVVAGTIAQPAQVATMAGGTSAIALSTNMADGVSAASEVRATATSAVTGGGANFFHSTYSLQTYAGVLGSVVQPSGSLSAMSAAAVSAINANTGSTGFSAVQSGSSFTTTAPVGSGATPNGANFFAIPATTDFGIGSSSFSGGAGAVSEVLATARVDLSGISYATISDLTVNGVSIINAAVPFNSTPTQTATDLAASINTKISTPDYTATASGAIVTISALAGTGATPNGFVVNLTTEARATCSLFLSGASFTSISALTINGVSVINAAVPYSLSDSQTATDLAASINTKVSSPDYTAVASGSTVTITAATSGTGPNGFPVVVTCAPALAIGSFVNMAGGAPSAGITFTLETRATGTVTLTGGASGSINTLTVNGVDLLVGVPVPFNTSLAQTANDLATAINQRITSPKYTASSAGAVVTIMAQPNAPGQRPNGFVVTATLTTITATFANMAGGVPSINGLKLGYATDGVLRKLSSQIWYAAPAASATGGYFRLVTANTDTGQADTTESLIRVQGTVGDLSSAADMMLLRATYGPEQSVAIANLSLVD